MTPFWAAALSLLLLVFIGVFARSPGRRIGGRPAIQATIDVYRQHLAERSADLAQGRLTQEQFDRERAEIEQRLAIDLRPGESPTVTRAPDDGDGSVTVYWLGMVLLLVALMLYLTLGAPALSG